MKILAEYLLSIKAIELNPETPFTWASGIKSPIYCDNRQTLSYPEIRNFIKLQFVDFIKKNYPQANTIAGVATGAIAIGALVADELDFPFVYIRAKAKEHGRKNLIEGKLPQNSNVVVIEDLISTGGSSIAAVEALRANNVNVLGLLAIFSYGFDIAEKAFVNAKCKFDTLSNYSSLIQVAIEKNYLKKEYLKILEDWRRNFTSV
ncbi:MAG: orotate phosphoribosyltransferase [Bacteroidales bacterium]|nr:orotate phosphoribosyltransferase [Bacteroidales bacterium]